MCPAIEDQHRASRPGEHPWEARFPSSAGTAASPPGGPLRSRLLCG